MKKDITIPKVEGVFMAVVLEENKDFRTMDWNAYLVNDKDIPLETVLIVTRGYDEKDVTSTMRHSIKELPPKSFARVEFLQDDVLRLNNEFSVSFFIDSSMFHKKFIFPKNSISQDALQDVPQMQLKGITRK